MSVVIDGTSGITFPDSSSQSAAAASGYPAQAWVNFNGSGTVAIRADGNVSSLTDNGTGQYTVNFSSTFSDANFSSAMNAKRYDVNEPGTFIPYSYATTSHRVHTGQGSWAVYDCSYVNVVMHR